jgi:hypothetical protein
MGCPVAFDAVEASNALPFQHVRRREGRADDLRTSDGEPASHRCSTTLAGTVSAVAVNGLIYGRQSNLL